MIRLKKGDILIFCFIIIVAVTIWFPKSKNGSKAILEVDGKRVETFDLSVDMVYEFASKYTNIITIKNGNAYISESNCPDCTCVRTGKISKSGEVICCLPNKLILRIERNDKMDVISG